MKSISTGTAIILLAIVSLAVFSVTLQHGFITTWDDDKYVVTNEIIRGFSPQNLRAAFSSFTLGNYAPLHHISYMLDHAFASLNPFAYHLHNIILHTLNGILVFVLALKIGNCRNTAVLAAFIFLVHPVQVESVAWISQRKNLLGMFFFLLSLLSYIGYREKEEKRYYWSSLGLFTLALLAKSAAIFLPPLLLVHDLCFTQRRGRGILLDKLPFALVALAAAAVTLISQMPQEGGGRADYYGGSATATLLTMIPVFCRYLYNIVWPLQLSADYLVPIKTAPDGEVAFCAAILAVLGLLLWCAARRSSRVAFWLAAAILAILPVSQIVPIVTLMNDRYLYFPMLGIAPLVAGLTVSLAVRRPPWRIAAVVLLACLATLPWLAYQRALVWRDGFTLWQDVLNNSPANHIAMTSLGDTYREEGKREEALRLYRQALAINPDYFIALNNISNLLLETENLAEAEGFIMRLIRKYPKYPKGFEMLGLLREASGDSAAAESAYSQALHLDPDQGEAVISLAAIFLQKGDLAAAEKMLDRAAILSNDSPELAYSLACLETRRGRIPTALGHLERASRSGAVDIRLALKDPCFAQLLETPEFRRLTGSPHP